MHPAMVCGMHYFLAYTYIFFVVCFLVNFSYQVMALFERMAEEIIFLVSRPSKFVHCFLMRNIKICSMLVIEAH